MRRLLILLGFCAALAQADPLSVPANLQADGIPPLQSWPALEGREGQSPRLLDWHPIKAEMLVLARSGASAQLHVLEAPLAKPRPLTQGRDAVSSARWEPEQGEYLVFARDQGGNEAHRLYRLRPGDAETPITPAQGRVSEWRFLPQGRGLVYLSERLNRERDQPLSRLVWLDPLQPEHGRVLGRSDEGRLTSLQVTPAGEIVALCTLKGRSQWLRFELDGREGRPLGAEQGAEDAAPGEDEEASHWIWSRQALQGDFRHLLRVDARSGQREALFKNLGADLEGLAPPPPGSGRPLALVSNQQGLSVLQLAGADGGLKRIAAELPAGLISELRWHPRLPLLAFQHVSAHNPGQLWVYELERDALQAWSHAADRREATQYQTLRWKSFDGLEISGLHVAPPDRFKGPRPVYIQLHGGPSAQSRPGHLSATLRALSEQLGVHLILPNVRGSDGFGKRFLNLDNGRKREDSVKDLSALLDLIATRPDMDAAQVVVAGGSYGGYLSLAVAVRESERIAGSICRVGIANFVSFLEHTEAYRRDNRRVEYGDERDPAMREFLQRISPLNQADRVRKPLFVVHGRNDPRVPYAEAEAMVQAVRAHGTPVWFLTADDEGHSFGKAENRDFLHQATLNFVHGLLRGPHERP